MSKNRNKLYQHILAQVRNSLNDNKITQKDVGDALGIKQSAVSSLLSGKSTLNMEQFLILCELIGQMPQNILSSATKSNRKTQQMSPAIERTLYRSDLHLLAYCLAIKEIGIDQIVLEGVSKDKLKEIFEELCQVGLLERRGDERYIQKSPDLVLIGSSRFPNSKAHQQVVTRSWDYFDRMYFNKAFLSNKFNAYELDRFTPSQCKEIEADLWKVYERIQTIKQHNLSIGYQNEEPMELWNIHLMMTTPVQVKEA